MRRRCFWFETILNNFLKVEGNLILCFKSFSHWLLQRQRFSIERPFGRSVSGTSGLDLKVFPKLFVFFIWRNKENLGLKQKEKKWLATHIRPSVTFIFLFLIFKPKQFFTIEWKKFQIEAWNVIKVYSVWQPAPTSPFYHYSKDILLISRSFHFIHLRIMYNL